MAADRGLERHELRVRVRELRDLLDQSQQELASTLGWSKSKVHRIEAGTNAISHEDLRALLALVPDIPSEERERLLTLARSGRRRPPAPAFPASLRASLPPSVRRYIEYEAAADEIWNFEPMFVPGLLQTPDYTRALLRDSGLAPPVSPVIERAVEIRRLRQHVLVREPSVQLHVLLDESAIVRQVGGADVMRQQLEHLWALSERPNVSLAIVPMSRGAYPGIRSPFVVMRFPDATRPELLFLENPLNEVIKLAGEDSAHEPAAYLAVFDDLVDGALTGAAVARRLKAALKSMPREAS
jgi:transcriptional regulator with XRE-family HTH domain